MGVECIMGLMEVEYVVIYVSVVTVTGLAESAYSLKTGSFCNPTNFSRAFIVDSEE